ncbi:MAG: hypothetical protein V9G18_07835, partial [Albidovulum sp.]
GNSKPNPPNTRWLHCVQIGIQPDAIVLRADRAVPDDIKRKISRACATSTREGVVAAVDAASIYDIPKVLHTEGLDAYVVRRLNLPFRDVTWDRWNELLRRVHSPSHKITLALVGKYVDLPDAYLSVTEALRAGGFTNDTRVNLRWVASDECTTVAGAERTLAGVDAICVPGGFGVRGIDGKLGALTWARERQEQYVLFLGSVAYCWICLVRLLVCTAGLPCGKYGDNQGRCFQIRIKYSYNNMLLGRSRVSILCTAGPEPRRLPGCPHRPRSRVNRRTRSREH